MWYYVASIILVSHISDVLTISEKIYKVCNGVYSIATYLMPNKKLVTYIEDDDEWIELKLLKNEACQTLD